MAMVRLFKFHAHVLSTFYLTNKYLNEVSEWWWGWWFSQNPGYDPITINEPRPASKNINYFPLLLTQLIPKLMKSYMSNLYVFICKH